MKMSNLGQDLDPNPNPTFQGYDLIKITSSNMDLKLV